MRLSALIRRCICAGVRAHSHEAAAALRRAYNRHAKHSAGDRRANHGQAEEAAVVEMHREVTVASPERAALASPQAMGLVCACHGVDRVPSGRSRSCSGVASSRALPRTAGGHVRGDCPFAPPRERRTAPSESAQAGLRVSVPVAAAALPVARRLRA